MFHTGLQFQVKVLALKTQYPLSSITWAFLINSKGDLLLGEDLWWYHHHHHLSSSWSYWYLALGPPQDKGWGGSEGWNRLPIDESLWGLVPWDQWSHVSCRATSSLRELVDHPSRGGDPEVLWAVTVPRCREEPTTVLELLIGLQWGSLLLWETLLLSERFVLSSASGQSR